MWSAMWRRSMEWGSGFESFRFSPRNVPPSFPHLFWKVPGTANDQCLETRMKPGFLHLFWPGASFLERKHTKSRLNTGFRRFFFLPVTHFLTHFPHFKAEKRGFAKKKCSFSNCKWFSWKARPRVLHTFGFLRPFWATFLCFRAAGRCAWRVFLYASPSPCSWAGAARLSNRAPSFPEVAASSPWRAWP